jgi:hypothetical protein
MGRKHHDMVNEIIANFDFERVNSVMTFLDWTWATCKNKVPSIRELKEAGEEHLYTAIEQVMSPNNTHGPDVAWISASGGLHARAWKDDKGQLDKIELQFIIEEWESDNDIEV